MQQTQRHTHIHTYSWQNISGCLRFFSSSIFHYPVFSFYLALSISLFSKKKNKFSSKFLGLAMILLWCVWPIAYWLLSFFILLSCIERILFAITKSNMCIRFKMKWNLFQASRWIWMVLALSEKPNFIVIWHVQLHTRLFLGIGVSPFLVKIVVSSLLGYHLYLRCFGINCELNLFIFFPVIFTVVIFFHKNANGSIRIKCTTK